MRAWWLGTYLLFACGGGEQPACAGDHECPSSQTCVDGRCMARMDAGGRDAGPCRDGCECLVVEDCPAVAACAQSACESNVCRAAPMHERCAPLGLCDVERGCVPFTDAGPGDGGNPPGDAGTDGGRDAGTDAGPTGPSIGDPCVDASQCAGIEGTPECLRRSPLDTARFEGGYCTVRCPTGMCPSGSVCWRARFTVEAYCLRECTSDAECRPEYACGTPRDGELARPTQVCFPRDGVR